MKEINPIHLALVDDDSLVVQLLEEYINSSDGFNVVLTAHSGNDFIEQLRNLDRIPAVVLLDLKMDDGDGLNTMSILEDEFPGIKIIVLSSYYNTAFTGQMLKAKADAFLSKETDKEELLKIIQEVVSKGHYFSPEQVSILREQLSSRAPQFHVHSKNTISDREREVLELICQQKTASEIAKKLFISEKTVNAHRSNLFVKTGVKNTAGLVIFAVRQGLVDVDKIVGY